MGAALAKMVRWIGNDSRYWRREPDGPGKGASATALQPLPFPEPSPLKLRGDLDHYFRGADLRPELLTQGL